MLSVDVLLLKFRLPCWCIVGALGFNFEFKLKIRNFSSLPHTVLARCSKQLFAQRRWYRKHKNSHPITLTSGRKYHMCAIDPAPPPAHLGVGDRSHWHCLNNKHTKTYHSNYSFSIDQDRFAITKGTTTTDSTQRRVTTG